MAGNGKCVPCPRNSDTFGGKVMCICKHGFYRLLGENYTQPCHGKCTCLYSVWKQDGFTLLFLEQPGKIVLIF